MNFKQILAACCIALCFGVRCGAAQSLADVPFAWKSDKDTAYSFDSLKGRPTVMTMIYTSCKSACPLTISRMKDVERGIGEQANKVNFVMVSFDDSNDTPKSLASLKKKHHLSDENWILLVGNPSDTRKLGVLLDIAYEKVPDSNDIVHGNRIIALDGNLEIASSIEGLSSDLNPLIAQVKAMLVKK